MPPKSHQANALDEPASPTLNKYRLLGQLAKGGMAEVFLARADGLGGFERLLVIKRILPELASDTEFVRMFLDEARIAATLHHSNIVQVYEVDIADGQVFYAMEHLHGQDVATTLRRLTERAMRLPLGNAIAIIAAVAAGLHYAHERRSSDGQPLNIVHRDVAPNNVIITYDGNVKLIDFGIAKAANNLSKTRFGLFKGKLPYASPEQCRCEPIDRRTDVFSLGVLLYELTTGQQLFTADNEYELLRVVSEAVVPRPRLRDKAYPRELEAIVLKALAQDREDRYSSAYALQRDLEMLASRMQLDLAAMSLSRLMERLFVPELAQWRTAERSGLTLEQHIITTTKKLGLDPAMVARRREELVAEAPTDLTLTSVRSLSGSRTGACDVTDRSDVSDVSDVSDASDVSGVSGVIDLGTAPEPIRIDPYDATDASAAPEPIRIDPVKLPISSSRRRPGVARVALIAAAAVGLLGAGAMGALWVSAQPSPSSTAPATQPRAELAPRDPTAARTGQAAVAPAPSEPATTEAPATSEPATRAMPTAEPPAPAEPAPRAIPTTTPPAPTESVPRAIPTTTPPAPTEPAPRASSTITGATAPAEPDAHSVPGSTSEQERPAQSPAAARTDADAEHAAPHPIRKPKRMRPRPASAPHTPPASERPAVPAPVERSHPVLDDATLDKVVPRSTGSP